MKKLLSWLLVLALCLTLGVGAFASGEPSGEAADASGEAEQSASGEASGGSSGMGGGANLAGMLSMKSYVVENDGSDAVSFEVYGVFKAGGEADAAAYVIDKAADPAALRYTVYADRAMTEEAEGVTAAVADGVLTVSGVATDENTAYYIGSDYEAETVAATVIYVVNDQYEAPVAYALRDGTSISLSEYAPGIASESSSNIYIGANTTLRSAADYGITDPADAAIADWWLGSGVTNAGTTLDEFGDTFYRFELSVDIYRQFQIVIDENTTEASAGGEFVEPTDVNGAMGSNDQFSDSMSATLYAGVWDGIYTVMKDGYLANIDGVDRFEGDLPVDEETLFVVLYNAFTTPWASLNEAGQALAAGLNAATAEEKVAQVKAALGFEDWAIEDYSTQKLAVLDVLKAADAYITVKHYPDAALQAAAEAAGYAVVTDATADLDSLMTGLAAVVVDADAQIEGEDLATAYPTSVFVKDAKVKIADSTIVSSGSNSEPGPAGQSAQELLSVEGSMPAMSTGGYNMTAANAFYRDGFGADLVAWGYDTVIELTTTTGELVISAPSNGSMAGGLFNAFGASILVDNAVAHSGGQHLSNTVYNGTLHYLDAAAIGGGRMFSSDFWGGNVVFENTVAYGGDVTDEPTAVITKNSVFCGTGSMNGYATMYFENALIEGGNFGTQNNTSLVSDAATITLVNSHMIGSSFLTMRRSSRAVATLVDSEVDLSGSVLATLTNAGYGPGNLGEDFNDMFQIYGEIVIYGNDAVNFEGDALTVSVDAGQSLRLYVKDIVGGTIENTGDGSFEIVYGDEYGTLYLNTEIPAAAAVEAAPAAAEAAAGENGEPAGFDASMNAGLDAGAYPHFDEYRDYVAGYILADDFMSGTPAYEDTYAAASPYIAPFIDINPVIGAMDYPDWMNANYPGEAFPAA